MIKKYVKSYIDDLKDFFSNKEHLKNSDFKNDVRHFSDLIPYRSADFNPEDDLHVKGYSDTYYLEDNSVLKVYECSSLVLSSDQTFESFNDIIKLSWPEGTVIQVMLYSDNYIDPLLSRYKELREGADNIPFFKEQINRICDFYRQGTSGMEQLSGNIVRSFKLYISFKVPMKSTPLNRTNFDKELSEYSTTFADAHETLKGMRLNPQVCRPDSFLSMLFGIFNPDMQRVPQIWDTGKYLNKQVIYSDTVINKGHNYLKFADSYAACMTPKTYPVRFNVYKANSLIGLISGNKSNQDDGSQIKCKFIYSLNIIKKDLKTRLKTKQIQVERQTLAGKVAPGVLLRVNEFKKAEVAIENGEEFVLIMPVLWLFHKDPDVLDNHVAQTRSVWRQQGVALQREQDYMLERLFMAALPGGLYGPDIESLQRTDIVPAATAPYMAAFNGGYKGMGDPMLLFLDRRGELFGLDFFNTMANKNWIIYGGTGGGKSFYTNYIVSNYYSCNYRIRIIDVGESYSKITYMVDGTYIYPLKQQIVVNFFETLKIPDFETDKLDGDEAEAVLGSLAMLTSIISTMAYSRTGAVADERTKVLIELAIKECYKLYRQNMKIDDVADFLNNLADYYRHTDGGKFIYEKYEKSIDIGYFLYESLQKFTSKGEYGRFFNGKTNIKLDNRLVVTELDNLPDDLKKVLVLAVASIISDEIYRGDKHPTLVILDEAWQTISENFSAAEFVEGLYRKIRKYNGSIGIVTQSAADLHPVTGKLKYLGAVLTSQSAFQFVINDQNFHKAAKEGVISVDDFSMKFFYDRMPDAATIGYKYSEILIKMMDGSMAVGRLMVDPFTYLINTSGANERDFIIHLTERHMKQGLNKRDAITRAVYDCDKIITELGSVRSFVKFAEKQMNDIRAGAAG